VLNNPVSKRLWDYLGHHPEQVFVLKALGWSPSSIFSGIFSISGGLPSSSSRRLGSEI
jgi:hypothetical protein